MERATRVNRHRRKFLLDNPGLVPVAGSDFEELLRWAQEKDFIEFKLFEGEEFYSDFDLKTAQMWKMKCKELGDDI